VSKSTGVVRLAALPPGGPVWWQNTRAPVGGLQTKNPGHKRRLTAAYLVGFLLAAVAAPHRHANALEDLLSDGPSDSGVVLDVTARLESGEPILEPLRILDDDPCLACFHHDFVATWTTVFVLTSPSTCLARLAARPLPAIPQPSASAPASRSPPAAS